MSSIRKGDLRTFIENKVDGQILAVTKRRNEWVRETIEALMLVWFKGTKLSEVERRAEQLYDLYGRELQNLKGVSYESGSGLLNKLKVLSYVQTHIRDDVVHLVTRHLFSPYESERNKHQKYNIEGLVDQVQKMEQPAIQYRKQLEDLKTLRKEALNIINVSTTGKDAYKNLIAVGLDLSDFQKSERPLPAVVKLSVEPCLLNGDCEEKSLTAEAGL